MTKLFCCVLLSSLLLGCGNAQLRSRRAARQTGTNIVHSDENEPPPKKHKKAKDNPDEEYFPRGGFR